MAWIILEGSACSPESEGLTSRSDHTSEQSPTVKSINTAKLSYCPECDQVTLIEPQSGTTLKPCKEEHWDPSKSFSAGSRNCAKTFPLLAAERAWMESAADYFLKSLGSLASYDPGSSSWKTFQLSVFGEEVLSSELWPASGMTAAGRLYPLPTLAPRTNGSDGGSWPTPTIRDDRGPNSNQTDIRQAVLKWATPTVDRFRTRGGDRRDEMGLDNQVKASARPTPRSAYAEGTTGGADRRSDLRDAVRDGRQDPDKPNTTGNLQGSLNPDWVECLMAYLVGWTVCDASVMQSLFPKRGKRSKDS